MSIAALYVVLKTLHVGSVVLTLTLFVVRAAWMVFAPARLEQRWVRVLPHCVDTVLLLSALGLVVLLGQYPGAQPWLSAKVLALLAYIVLGTIGLKRGPTKAIRSAACIAALLVFAYIVSVALSHNPYGFFA
ncbi:invasion gene expression up-regulator SirB [Salinisphaera sp. T5B8]|uniref:SirB2 family protein n=1 Tax=Salinisphaera sp. T5B8 TaxID=1304154 RepID=UPI00334023FF